MFRTACCAGPPPGNSDMIRVRLRLELMNMINWTRIKILLARIWNGRRLRVTFFGPRTRGDVSGGRDWPG